MMFYYGCQFLKEENEALEAKPRELEEYLKVCISINITR